MIDYKLGIESNDHLLRNLNTLQNCGRKSEEVSPRDSEVEGEGGSAEQVLSAHWVVLTGWEPAATHTKVSPSKEGALQGPAHSVGVRRREVRLCSCSCPPLLRGPVRGLRGAGRQHRSVRYREVVAKTLLPPSTQELWDKGRSQCSKQ